MSAWRRADRLEERRAEGERHESRHLSLYIDEDGMYVVRGRLDPEAGALLEKALESAGEALFGRRPESRAESGSKSRQTSRADSRSESTPAAQRLADAMGLVAERALVHRAAGPSRPSFEVVVHVDAEALRQDSAALHQDSAALRQDSAALHQDSAALRQDSAALRQDPAALRQDSAAGQAVIAGGARVSAETSRRLACDAGRRVMTYDENGSTLDVGRRSRTVRRRSGARSSTVTAGAGFRAATCATATRITSCTGPTAAPRRLPTWCCCAVVIIARCTRQDSVSNATLPASCGFITRTAASYPMCPLHRRCRPISRAGTKPRVLR